MDEIHQDRIPDIAYQAQLDQEIVDEDSEKGPSDYEMGSIVPPLRASDIRYWSDFNRVYYLPRSIHQLPDLADWEAGDGDWQGGKETFSRYNSVSYESRLTGGTWLMYSAFTRCRTVPSWMTHFDYL